VVFFPKCPFRTPGSSLFFHCFLLHPCGWQVFDQSFFCTSPSRPGSPLSARPLFLSISGNDTGALAGSFFFASAFTDSLRLACLLSGHPDFPIARNPLRNGRYHVSTKEFGFLSLPFFSEFSSECRMCASTFFFSPTAETRHASITSLCHFLCSTSYSLRRSKLHSPRPPSLASLGYGAPFVEGS